ncbi:MAG: right-handed parallel beta-helix repeat-containing protein [Gemmatimonadetes bacterium]|nr:right-handed parallel beta-helix repeat-containing protein [Gemmatimonadota bacterium]
MTLTPASIAVAQASSATALVRDVNGTIMTGQTVTWSIVNNGVASITTSGVATGVSAGTTTVSASVQGVTGSATLTVTAVSPIATPQLPRAVPALPVAALSRSCTDRPTTVAALQQALNAGGARTICLAMGLVLKGSFDIPARAAGDTSWSILRADTTLTLGSRITGSERLPKIEIVDVRFPALWFHSRSARWVVQGIEMTTDPNIIAGPLSLVEAGERIAETTIAALPREIHFTHVNVHGWPNQNLRRGFMLNGAGHIVRDSRCTEIHERNSDSQCTLSYNGPGPFLIENNLLEAASENVMWGGADPGISGLVPCDITVRNNRISKPATWKQVGTPSQAGSYLIKLLYESKSSCRSLIEGNSFDGVWKDGQMGYAVWLKSVNQQGNCRWCRTTDVTFRNNTFRNVGAGFAFSGSPEVFPVDSALSRVLVTGNWIENINVQPYDGDSRPILLNVNARDVSFIRNTWTGGNFPKDAIIFDLSNGVKAVTNFRFEDNVIPTAQYGVGATAVGEGTVALNAGVGGSWTFLRNTFIGNQRNGYPATTKWASSLAGALSTGSGVAAPPVP